MIPPLDNRGLLPEGVHTAASWDEIAIRFAINQVRQGRLEEMFKFIRSDLRRPAAGLELYVGGSYFSDILFPGDIDCTVCIPLAEIANRIDLIRLCANEGGKGRIWQQHKIEIYPSFELPGSNDFREFFQYVGEKTASLKQIHQKDRRGIIKVEQWIVG